MITEIIQNLFAVLKEGILMRADRELSSKYQNVKEKWNKRGRSFHAFSDFCKNQSFVPCIGKPQPDHICHLSFNPFIFRCCW
jgi:hypothetical protein